MNFSQLSWGAVCFYYRALGDHRYSKIMRDTQFLSRLRREPFNIGAAEFEEKVLLDHINIENYDLLIGHGLARNVLDTIIKLMPETSPFENITLLDCDLSDRAITRYTPASTRLMVCG